MLIAAAPASASEPLSNTNVQDATLHVNAKGEALVTYHQQNGTLRHVLVWGAVNANPPSETTPQVRFKYDYAGGYGKYRNPRYWKTITRCGAYDGPALAMLVAACKAPDGSYWAIQSWQRALPLLGFAPFKPGQRVWEMQISHWTGDLPVLEVAVHWTYGHSAIGVFGRLTYDGVPVHGFHSTKEGNPLGRYERNVFIDTHNSAYGKGWKRESGILTHNPNGGFCHSFVRQKPFPGYPSKKLRPAAPGDAYRFTVAGPGVTPIIRVTIAGVQRWEGTPVQVAAQEAAQQLWDSVMPGDRRCAPENGLK
jgi:hypothetical protein